MTQAQRTHSGTSSLLPAAAAAIVMAAALSVAGLVSGQVTLPAINRGATINSQEQAVIDSGSAWVFQRQQQAGFGLVTPAVHETAQRWEAERKAQMGFGATNDDGTYRRPEIR